MVPDLGSKYPEPTSGANAGVYNNVRKIDDTTGTEKSRSGVGIDAEAAIGNTNVTVTYSGSFNSAFIKASSELGVGESIYFEWNGNIYTTELAP